jgi:hypothetical protein
MNYRERRAEACRELFASFHPDFSGCRDKDRANEILEMAREGMFSADIAQRLGITPKAVQKLYRRYNFPQLQNFSPPLREERVGWTGGVKEVRGYLYSRSPGHPRASKYGNYVAVHRLVMEKKLGRYLKGSEVVDHIDGNTRNNHPDNLRVFPNNAEHLRVTLKGRVPNWSPEGKARMGTPRKPNQPSSNLEAQPSLDSSESDARPLQTLTDHPEESPSKAVARHMEWME